MVAVNDLDKNFLGEWKSDEAFDIVVPTYAEDGYVSEQSGIEYGKIKYR